MRKLLAQNQHKQTAKQSEIVNENRKKIMKVSDYTTNKQNSHGHLEKQVPNW